MAKLSSPQYQYPLLIARRGWGTDCVTGWTIFLSIVFVLLFFQNETFFI